MEIFVAGAGCLTQRGDLGMRMFEVNATRADSRAHEGASVRDRTLQMNVQEMMFPYRLRCLRNLRTAEVVTDGPLVHGSFGSGQLPCEPGRKTG